MGTALIFGVTGQDGSYLSEFLIDKGYQVVGVRRRSASGSLWRLEKCIKSPLFKLVEGDLTDYSSCLSLLNKYKPDEIYNLAAQSNVGVSFEQPGLTFEITAKGVLNLLEVIRLTLPTARLYQASSSEMFGSSGSVYNNSRKERLDFRGRVPDVLLNHSFQDETTKFTPQSPYAIAKLAAHNLINLYRFAYDIFAVGGILFNHESPRRGIGFVTRKITSWLHNLRIGGRYESLKLGNLDSSRDWGYAKEYVEAMWLMLQQSTPKDYVIGTGETHTVKEFLDLALELGAARYNYYFDLPQLVELDNSLRRPAEVPYLRADSTLAQLELGWKPKTTFKELVKIMVEQENGQA